MGKFDAIISEMKDRYRLRIRKWRRQMSGCSWRVRYSDGRAINWVESPRRTPLSLAIFLHEVGHHALGFDHGLPSCQEEYHVWQWSLKQMKRHGVEPDDRVLDRVEASMEYAVRKALRRGMMRLPPELQRFAPRAA